MSDQKLNCLITGAAGTLGKAIAIHLGRLGHSIALIDLDQKQLDATQQRLQSEGITCQGHVADVTSPEAWKELLEALRREWTSLHVLINNAGVLEVEEFARSDWQRWRSVVEVNLLGTALGCHAAGSWLMESATPGNPSRVLNIASYTGFVPIPWASAYTVSKSGVIALSESMAIEWHSDPVTVTVACPGFFPSGLFSRRQPGDATLAAAINRFVEKSSLDASSVADAAVAGMFAGRSRVIVPARARWLWRLKRWMPDWFLRRLARISHSYRARLQRRLEEES